jgi:uncharacterized protein (UPF0264 family)
VQRIPELLVSVRCADEAAEAHTGGAQWIDLKEPLAGPLGAVSLEAARQVISALPTGKLVTAALGELSDWHTQRCSSFSRYLSYKC